MPTETIAVVSARFLPVVEQLEAHAIGQPGLERAPAGDGELLLRERDAGHVDAELARKEQAHAAPARSDVQHLLAGPQQQLRGDVALLVVLRLVERFVAGL